MRIWFNRGYSLASIAKAMLAANPSLEVLVSITPGQAVRPGPTATWIEPACDDEAYVVWTRAQIVEHGIDLLVPTRRRKLLASADLPCQVHMPTSAANLDLIEDKFAFSQALVGEPIQLPTEQITSADQLRWQLERFAQLHPGAEPCVKPRFGVNGHGFWKLTDGSPSAHLMDPDAREMRRDLYLAAIEAGEKIGSFQPLVLMDFLPGPEVSFDVLAHEGALLKYVARTKQEKRQRLQSRHPLGAAARDLVRRFNLHGLVNIQFRKDRAGDWRALEINARPAGGSTYSEPFGSRLIGDWGALLAGTMAPEDVALLDIYVEIEMISSHVPVTTDLAA